MDRSDRNNRKHLSLPYYIFAVVGLCVIAGVAVYLVRRNEVFATGLIDRLEAALSTAQEKQSFTYTFNTDGILSEAGSMSESTSPYFWLNSGGLLTIDNGIGHTIQGELQNGEYWQQLYKKNNSLDTDGGKYPQNIFRLLTQHAWENISASVKVRVNHINPTNTPNRGPWSGIFLMTRYKDSDNLYYAGIRMDGSAVIKKKSKGIYYTLAQQTLPYTKTTYDYNTNPNVIPLHTWMRIKSETRTLSQDTVRIILAVDYDNDGTYDYTLTATDDGLHPSSGRPLRGPGHAGIRTDYLNAFFDDFTLSSLR